MELKKINDYTWEIPKHGEMKVHAVFYSSPKLLESSQKDNTVNQAQNVACLPGIQRASYVMPDAHQGYGFPIGGVAAFDMENGIISPGGVGYDINCGVRLLRSDYSEKDIRSKVGQLLAEIYNQVPSGVGKGGIRRLNQKALLEVCVKGAEWAVENDFGTEQDLSRTEEYGRMKGAEPSFLSKRAIERGLPQLGSLGAGNHFLEIQKVDKIFDKKIAGVFGIHSIGQIMVMIHCGSRGLGHQVASDYIKQMENKFGIKGLPDRQLINAPLHSELGQKYYKAMKAAVNFAFTNRHMIAHRIRCVFEKVMGSSETMDQIYDVCHNVAKFENHKIDGHWKEVCIHRKGATRSFGPGREEIPEAFRSIGQPVLIPGSMGTASYVLVGTKKAEEKSFGSTAHGAGRVISRKGARRNFRAEDIKMDMNAKGIELKSASLKGVAEESSEAYKDVDEVVEVSHKAGIGNLVARLVPVGVIKG